VAAARAVKAEEEMEALAAFTQGRVKSGNDAQKDVEITVVTGIDEPSGEVKLAADDAGFGNFNAFQDKPHVTPVIGDGLSEGSRSTHVIADFRTGHDDITKIASTASQRGNQEGPRLPLRNTSKAAVKTPTKVKQTGAESVATDIHPVAGHLGTNHSNVSAEPLLLSRLATESTSHTAPSKTPTFGVSPTKKSQRTAPMSSNESGCPFDNVSYESPCMYDACIRTAMFASTVGRPDFTISGLKSDCYRFTVSWCRKEAQATDSGCAALSVVLDAKDTLKRRVRMFTKILQAIQRSKVSAHAFESSTGTTNESSAPADDSSDLGSKPLTEKFMTRMDRDNAVADRIEELNKNSSATKMGNKSESDSLVPANAQSEEENRIQEGTLSRNTPTASDFSARKIPVAQTMCQNVKCLKSNASFFFLSKMRFDRTDPSALNTLLVSLVADGAAHLAIFEDRPADQHSLTIRPTLTPAIPAGALLDKDGDGDSDSASDRPMYHVVFGGGKQRNVIFISRGDDEEPRVQFEEKYPVIDAVNRSKFWVDMRGGGVSIGYGDVVGINEVLNWTEPNGLKLHYVAVHTNEKIFGDFHVCGIRAPL
jgi:hypothetical protein